jgi:DNA invertase Pin-like site-specific DNA recombinase
VSPNIIMVGYTCIESAERSQMAVYSRSIGYVRQWHNGLPIPEQIKKLGDFGCHIDNVWIDGPNEGYPQLSLARMDARSGDTFVVVRLLALGITSLRLGDVLKSLSQQGIHFCAINDGIDTREPNRGGFLIPSMLQTLDLWRKLRSQATRDGLEEARAQGRVGGRRSVMSSEKMAMANELISSRHHTMAQIAEMLGVSRSSLYNSGLVVRPSKASAEKTRAAH